MAIPLGVALGLIEAFSKRSFHAGHVTVMIIRTVGLVLIIILAASYAHSSEKAKE